MTPLNNFYNPNFLTNSHVVCIHSSVIDLSYKAITGGWGVEKGRDRAFAPTISKLFAFTISRVQAPFLLIAKDIQDNCLTMIYF